MTGDLVTVHLARAEAEMHAEHGTQELAEACRAALAAHARQPRYEVSASDLIHIEMVDLTVVVNGHAHAIQVSTSTPFRQVVVDVLEQTGNNGRPPEDWELRDNEGYTLVLDTTVAEGEDTWLWLNLRAGVGASQPPAEAKLPATTDASVWADEFMRTIQANTVLTWNRGFLIGWFANAIETGRNAATDAQAEADRLNGVKPLPPAFQPSLVDRVDALPEGAVISGLVDGKFFAWVRRTNGSWYTHGYRGFSTKTLISEADPGSLQVAVGWEAV